MGAAMRHIRATLQTIDYIVLVGYLVATALVGVLLAKKVKNAGDMFAAGGSAPFWASGLSAFMTMFSAGTFVVWGKVAYLHGFVAVSINLCYGVAALLVGWFVAGRWQKLGIRTPAEYVERRFGRTAMHVYTWVMMVARLMTVAVALYSLAKITSAAMPLPEGHALRSAETGNLSHDLAIVVLGAVVVLYTLTGGLWAVLITDVLQFLVLNLVVAFVVPLVLSDVGGFSGFIENAPDGFFSPVGGGYGWFFLAGWCLVHFFMVGAEFAFVQRYLCVSRPREAQKSAWLFGVLYLVSPFFWMLPPLVYRVIDPNVDPEQAYVLACRSVLPAGMVGLLLAAMFSATASMVSSQLNVFAGVLTQDVWRRLRPNTGDRGLLRAGRVFSGVLGLLLIVIALLVPVLGGAEEVVIKVTSLMMPPLLAPSLFGLFHRRLRWNAVVVAFSLSFLAGALSEWVFAEQLAQFGKATSIVTGTVLPVVVLAAFAWLQRRGPIVFEPGPPPAVAPPSADAARSAADIVAGAIVACGGTMALLALIGDDRRGLLLGFAGALVVIGLVVWRTTRPK